MEISASISDLVAVAANSPFHKRHVEGRMLAAHEVCDIHAVPAPEREQQQRPALGVGGDHDEGAKAVAIADLALPGREESNR